MGFGLSVYIPLVLYVAFFVVALLTIFHRIEWSLLYLALILPIQNIQQKMHAYPLGKDLVDILIVSALLGWFVTAGRKNIGMLQKTPLNVPILFYIYFTFRN